MSLLRLSAVFKASVKTNALFSWASIKPLTTVTSIHRPALPKLGRKTPAGRRLFPRRSLVSTDGLTCRAQQRLVRCHVWSYDERERHILHRKSLHGHQRCSEHHCNEGIQFCWKKMGIPIRRFSDIPKSWEFIVTVPKPVCGVVKNQLPDSAREANNKLSSRGLTVVASKPSNTEQKIWFDSNS